MHKSNACEKADKLGKSAAIGIFKGGIIKRWMHGLFVGLLVVAPHVHATRAAVPELAGLVVDEAKMLDEGARAALQSRLETIQAAGRAQIAILLSRGTDGEPLADYSLRVAEAWQLGRAKRDDGLLILVNDCDGGA